MPKYETKADARRARYRIGRLQLIYKLGGVCVDCGEDDPDVLQFDHMEARTWQASKTSRWVRLANYKREADAGLVELRCKPCNQTRLTPPDQGVTSMSKRTPRLPMGGSGYREAKRQIKMKETLRVRAEKKARKAAQPVARELRPGRELARRILQLDRAHPAMPGSNAAMEVPGEMWAEWLRLAKMEDEKA